MTGDQIQNVVLKCRTILIHRFDTKANRNIEASELKLKLEHLHWMCNETFSLVANNRIEKAFRWLGFIQGALWALGIQSIEEAKRDNAPPDAEFDKNRI